MPARNIQIVAVIAVVAVVAIVLAVTQFSAGSDDDPTAVPSPSATAMPSPGASPTVDNTATPDPTETPTPVPSPTPTPTPEPPDAAFLAIILLANEMGAAPADFTVRSYEEATWPAADYGCPAPGTLYAQGEVDGWAIEVERQGQVFEFHADANDVSGETLVNCTKNRELLEGTVNPVELAGLRSTTTIEMWRRNGEGTYDLTSTVTDSAQINAIINTLDVPVALSTAAFCTPVFRLVFVTPGGDQTFDTICSGGNSRLLRGGQGFWNGMDGIVPREFSSIIGPYYSDVPLPVPPTASPTATGQ